MTANRLNINDDGLQDYDSTAGTFTAIDLTDRGDLLAHTGSIYQRLPVGNNGYVLKADSDESVGLRWACAGFEFLESQTASSSTSIEFNDFADSACYGGYKLVWKNVTRSASDIEFRLRFSTDNGSTWLTSGYKYMRESIRDTDGLQQFPYSASSGHIYINGYTGPTTDHSFNGEAYFYPGTNLSSGLTYTSMTSSPSSQFLQSRGYAINTTSSAIDGFQFYMDSGSITAGTLSLYGVLK